MTTSTPVRPGMLHAMRASSCILLILHKPQEQAPSDLDVSHKSSIVAIALI
jgi:hypothetical protein